MKIRLLFLLFLSLFLQKITYAAPPSLREEIGQMLIIGFEGKTITKSSPITKIIDKSNIGGVILFDYNYVTKAYDKNIESPEQVKTLNQDLQYFNHQANLKHNRAQLPLIISVDYEGGKVDRLKEKYGFPKTFTAAEISEMPIEEAKKQAMTMAETLKNSGFNLDFSPVLDVNVNPDNPIIGKLERSFSAQPQQVALFANLFNNQFLNHKIQCAYKHFPGHGSSTTDSHLGFVDITDTWQGYELLPYEILLNSDQACGVIMTAHVVNRQLDKTGLPATLSYNILTNLLRKKLNFNGVIVTDDMQMKAISENYGLPQALTLAINAGADMFIFGNQLTDKPQNPEEIINIIEAKVNSGEISQQRIDDAYQHILALKQTLSIRYS
ncbi:glycoside hydrolase family 3 N-terminal domain-containing protein [Legionella gresilensis]|uniref:glycoside hydrolase family 3 N-terminal domain-containing protein n=1 Tax=Legionella gresilensis TaxID=91823 RepID=UPI001041A424|nr:glycoside hydrolase family 3 N-terminal domain-containing protein [Legionella gresilensis]